MTLPNFSFEKRLWKRRYKFVAGLDEVGRGCFAGPVVASAVCFAPKSRGLEVRIDDSKKLTRKRRGLADSWIRENAVTWGVGEASVAEINRLGIVKATNIAFRRAIGSANRRLHFRIQYLLIDAFYIPYTRDYPIGGYLPENGRQNAIVNGDEKSLSIAAASIVAKVYRDLLMEKLGKGEGNRVYDWENNKGYGTKSHRDAILKNGVTRHHRKQFVKNYLRRVEGK